MNDIMIMALRALEGRRGEFEFEGEWDEVEGDIWGWGGGGDDRLDTKGPK